MINNYWHDKLKLKFAAFFQPGFTPKNLVSFSGITPMSEP